MAAPVDRLTRLLRRGSVLVLDGAMGTMLQAAAGTLPACPEELNLDRPDLVRDIHRAYVRAGARVLETNTFGANPRKLGKAGLGSRLADVVRAGVALAREAAGNTALVAGSVGPLGVFLEPVGTLPRREAYDDFLLTARLFREAGVDLLIIETMADLAEVRAACRAARDAGLPFAASMTFEPDGRTVLGTPPEAFAATAESLGAVMVGANCSAGPEGLLPVARALVSISRRPVFVQPNAGLPIFRDGATVFPAGPDEFAEGMEPFLAAGVRVLGGCCGTTPPHIKVLADRVRGRRAALAEAQPGTRLASRTALVLVGSPWPVAVVGERINPSGRRALADELRRGDLETVRREAVEQVRSGAHLLDLNAGAAGIDEVLTLPAILDLVQRCVTVPPVLDSTAPAVLEAALEAVDGRAVINSVNASARSLETILPLAARHGAALVALSMDESGIPADAAGRLRLAELVLRRAESLGLAADDLLVDCLAVAAGSEQGQVAETLRAITLVRSKLGVGTILGVSNVSYGLPAREELNAAFLGMAVAAGLDAAIVNPHSRRIMDALAAAQVLAGRDPGAAAFIAAHRGDREAAGHAPAPPADPRQAVERAVIEGDAPTLVRLVRELLDRGADPMAVNGDYLVPALEKVGDLFEKRTLFLPQVLASAEAVREAFAAVRERLPRAGGGQAVRVLLSTVEGDIHDLGKNIVRSLMENFGFEVIDLGTNVPAKLIAERAGRGDIRLVGLSALMTTTLPALESALRQVRAAAPGVPVMVGGAVLTPEYAAAIGADGYAPDAPQAVRVARRLTTAQG